MMRSVTRRGFFWWLATCVPAWVMRPDPVRTWTRGLMTPSDQQRFRARFRSIPSGFNVIIWRASTPRAKYSRIRIAGPVMAASPPGAFIRAAHEQYAALARDMRQAATFIPWDPSRHVDS